MNRKSILSAAFAAMLSLTGVSAANANPFVDVPTGHWAYDAVGQLAASGVIEGYGDNTFRGKQPVTRYEMAQMIARATANRDGSGKLITASDRALIDRLTAEFSDELNNLGVRVSELERNADMVKWTGELRYIYRSDRRENRPKSNTNRAELRLFPTAEVNDHWKIKARLRARANLREDSASDAKINYVYAEGKYKHFGINLGKMSNYSTNDDGLVLDDYFSGVQLTFGTKLNAVLEAGRWDMTSGNGAGAEFTNDTAANYHGAQLNYTNGKLFAGVGYRHFQSDGFKSVVGYSRDGKEDEANVLSFGANYRFDKNWTLAGAVAKNTRADALDTGHNIKLSYKGAKRTNAKTWGAYVAYRYISKNVSFAPTYESQNNRKGYEVGLQYVPMRNVLADALYFNGNNLDNNKDSKTLYARVRFYF